MFAVSDFRGVTRTERIDIAQRLSSEGFLHSVCEVDPEKVPDYGTDTTPKKTQDSSSQDRRPSRVPRPQPISMATARTKMSMEMAGWITTT